MYLPVIILLYIIYCVNYTWYCEYIVHVYLCTLCADIPIPIGVGMGMYTSSLCVVYLYVDKRSNPVPPCTGLIYYYILRCYNCLGMKWYGMSHCGRQCWYPFMYCRCVWYTCCNSNLQFLDLFFGHTIRF